MREYHLGAQTPVLGHGGGLGIIEGRYVRAMSEPF